MFGLVQTEPEGPSSRILLVGFCTERCPGLYEDLDITDELMGPFSSSGKGNEFTRLLEMFPLHHRRPTWGDLPQVWSPQTTRP